ncbi:TetR/AcrR family transcriptional regulator [Radicibacter daui]|uniref:TetR/AcrR family transcriptional regulator n=1 Tax=Radicibacter daui TaxID=3064829 RepID=UPI004046D187
MSISHPLPDTRRDAILRAVIPVFGHYGFRKASVDDLAAAAGLSKQGLYLHFSGKDQIFSEALRLYLEDGLELTRQVLALPGEGLEARLVAALDAWFGRHLVTFSNAFIDVIDAGDRISPQSTEFYRQRFTALLEAALAQAPEIAASGNVCTPAELAEVLFTVGLTWKERPRERELFRRSMALCVRAICQLKVS